MAAKPKVLVVLVTCAKKAEAERIARKLIEKRLAACGNVIACPITSIYRWKGKVKRAKEVLLILKTTSAKFAALERQIRAIHSYETPEVIAMQVAAGSKPYLNWVRENAT